MSPVFRLYLLPDEVLEFFKRCHLTCKVQRCTWLDSTKGRKHLLVAILFASQFFVSFKGFVEYARKGWMQMIKQFNVKASVSIACALA